MKDSFHYLKNVIFSISEGCQSHSPRERVTMFSHAAGAAPVAGLMVAPVSPTRPGAQLGMRGTAALAPSGKPGEREEDFCD